MTLESDTLGRKLMYYSCVHQSKSYVESIDKPNVACPKGDHKEDQNLRQDTRVQSPIAITQRSNSVYDLRLFLFERGP